MRWYTFASRDPLLHVNQIVYILMVLFGDEIESNKFHILLTNQAAYRRGQINEQGNKKSHQKKGPK